MRNLPDTRSPNKPSIRRRKEKIVPASFSDKLVHHLSDHDEINLDHVVIGILTALPHECAAVREVFGCEEIPITGPSTGTSYHLAKLYGKTGEGIVIAVSLLTNMGTNPAATKVANMLNDCKNIKDVVVCGIAGAIPSPENPGNHVRLGDIVLSTEGVMQYDFGKQHGDKFETNPQHYQPSTRLADAARKLRADEELGSRPWETLIDTALETLPVDFHRPPDDKDILLEADLTIPRFSFKNITDQIRKACGFSPTPQPVLHPEDNLRKPGYPRVFDGLVGSANRVLKSQKEREHLRKQYPKLRAIEMEGVGVAESCRAKNVGYFMVRGTCDYCNEPKNDVWQRYAAVVAAAYARALLEEIDIDIFATQPKVLTKLFVAAELSANNQFMDEEINQSDAVSKRVSDQSISTTPSKSPNSATQDIPLLPPKRKNTNSLYQKNIVTETFPNITRDVYEQLKEQKDSEKNNPKTKYVTNFDDNLDQELIVKSAEEKYTTLDNLLEKWEFRRLFIEAEDMVEWTSRYETKLPSEIISKIYLLLARIKFSQRNEPGALDLARAYLEKAKNAKK